MPAVLSPSTIATTFVSINEGADADIVVRRDRGAFFRRWALDFTCIALLVAIVPMWVVIWRREPAYFTNGIVLTMLIVAVAILVFGVLGAYLWSISKVGRRYFDVPFLHLNAAGVTARVDDIEQAWPWSRLTAMRLVGAGDRSLAITVTPAVVIAEQDAEPGVDPQGSSAPFEQYGAYAPPDSDWQPSREDFNAIAAGPNTSDEDLGQDAVASDTEHPGRSERDAHWRRVLYGTPYVVQMRGCNPPLSEIGPTVHNLSHGRVSIPEVTDGVLVSWWRSMLANEPEKLARPLRHRRHPGTKR